MAVMASRQGPSHLPDPMKATGQGRSHFLLATLAISNFQSTCAPRLNPAMAQLLRGIVCLLSISSVVLAASSWSFSDAALAVGPKGKDATASHTYLMLLPILEADRLDFLLQQQ